MIFLVTNGGYMFFYETHMHTSEGSACGFASGAMQARHYKALGYDGIVVTEHFFNGNSRINVDFPFESWERKIDLFCKGYENAYDEGKKIGLKVFFGFEFNYKTTEWLVYGIGKDFLKAHPEIMEMPPEKFLPLFKENGGFIIQAHPFREASYISTMRVCPGLCDALEVYNANNTERSNICAEFFAGQFQLRMTCGSDCHKVTQEKYSAMGSDTQITCLSEFCKSIAQGRLKLIKDFGKENI